MLLEGVWIRGAGIKPGPLEVGGGRRGLESTCGRYDWDAVPILVRSRTPLTREKEGEPSHGWGGGRHIVQGRLYDMQGLQDEKG